MDELTTQVSFKADMFSDHIKERYDRLEIKKLLYK